MTVLDDTLERADPDCLAPAAEAWLLRGAPWRRLAVLGDSVAAGVREPRPGYRDQCFADRVAAALERPGFRYRNLGAAWASLRDVRDGQLPAALSFRPDLALVVAGGNDALQPDYTPDRAWQGLLEIAGPLADHGVLVVTIGMFDLARSGAASPRFAATMTDRFDELDRITAAVAAQVGGLHVDTHHHPRASDPEIFASDRIHANAAGHAIASAAIVRRLASHPSLDAGTEDPGRRGTPDG
ncbi:SGNH/GDSL hydrolase family protein [Frankia sp. AgB1.9]|uniref:SGNH/GDSL hydrolase family protein n=1 Tax=unclassified Frankia TaxID=2632575 RepID=UPI0019331F8D|nr:MULTISPECIES: SGNH/GDSL hydrolase family protein [unclassified Frankia]MBL7489878.1 SGNH/GDSL hydrolase family protein [Frankia sp. AgW1.1]MBL7550252.1 SGNH/GDSL hydrolase family protein [Frankia sp. AgB1.9]MBL7624456.1 SGNH/GDSL hydrolase family protein [Frankia sp. AgB1.8]